MIRLTTCSFSRLFNSCLNYKMCTECYVANSSTHENTHVFLFLSLSIRFYCYSSMCISDMSSKDRSEILELNSITIRMYDKDRQGNIVCYVSSHDISTNTPHMRIENKETIE